MTAASEHTDVLIVGAGLSGIGLAWHLQQGQPHRSYAILEARAASGGTWDLFRYPGVRSDSDLATFAYGFRPWTGEQAIADGAAVLDYIRATAAQHGIDRRIRFGHKVVRAAWSSAAARWTVDVEFAGTGERIAMTCDWLVAATGYYRYDEGYTPRFPDAGDFGGRIVHPQAWPEDLEVAGGRIVVIGSGATAVTLVPALAARGARVTMLQRSPSYVMPVPRHDAVADRLRAWFGPARGHRLTRRKNIWQQRAVYRLCRRRPAAARRVIRRINARMLPAHVDVDTHFSPRYDPWDERLCVVPNGDLFRAFHDRSAETVTDGVDRFTARGLRLNSGRELEADIVVTATGLNLLVLGGIALEVDGDPVTISDTTAYRSMMLSGVPNLAFAVGYTNASWTLKVDLVGRRLVDLLRHMRQHGFQQVVAVVDDATMERRPLLDISAGYVLRALPALPRQGTRDPWRVVMDYREDVRQLRRAPVADPALRFA